MTVQDAIARIEAIHERAVGRPWDAAWAAADLAAKIDPKDPLALAAYVDLSELAARCETTLQLQGCTTRADDGETPADQIRRRADGLAGALLFDQESR